MEGYSDEVKNLSRRIDCLMQNLVSLEKRREYILYTLNYERGFTYRISTNNVKRQIIGLQNELITQLKAENII